MPLALKFIIDASLGRIVPDFSPVDMIELEKLSQERLQICKLCSEFISTEDPELYKCNSCGCNLRYKIKRFYPFDENNSAVFILKPDGTFINVCPLKKW